MISRRILSRAGVIQYSRTASRVVASSRVAIVLAVLPTLLSAQRLVLPMGKGVAQRLATSEANSGFHLPSRQAPSRVVTVYRGVDLGLSARGMTIRSLAFRRDGQRTTTHKAHRFKTTIEMSSRAVRLPSVIRDHSFDAAHGTNRLQVLGGKFVDWPAANKPTTPPAPFVVKVVLDRPFVLAKGENLCVDIRSEPSGTGAENHYWYVDAEAFDRSAMTGSVRNLGRGCPFGFQLRVASPPIDGETSIEAWAWTRATRPSRSYLALGDRSQVWRGQKLPLDFVGASGCRLYVAPMAIRTASSGSDSRGTARFHFPAPPRDPRFVGMVLHLQSFVEDASVGPLGIRASSWVEATLGKTGDPLPARTLYDSGPSLDDVPTASRDLGLVIELSSS